MTEPKCLTSRSLSDEIQSALRMAIDKRRHEIAMHAAVLDTFQGFEVSTEDLPVGTRFQVWVWDERVEVNIRLLDPDGLDDIPLPTRTLADKTAKTIGKAVGASKIRCRYSKVHYDGTRTIHYALVGFPTWIDVRATLVSEEQKWSASYLSHGAEAGVT